MNITINTKTPVNSSKTMKLEAPLDIIGIGAGPANLSLAALAQPTPLKTCFLEKQADYAWHKGLLLPQTRMQTSFLKDLVTCVDPTHHLSFLNYLSSQGRLYPFLASGQSNISRQEFSKYLRWASQQLPSVKLGETVEKITYKAPYFSVSTNQRTFKSRFIVAGTGMQPYVPPCTQELISPTCFHASTLDQHLKSGSLDGKRIAIIGGGQTGADVFQSIFSGHFGNPSNIDWISRRPNLEALDEGVFTDEYFMPQYVEYFHHLPDNVKRSELKRQKLTSDGITNECLEALYQALYYDRFVSEEPNRWHIHCHHELTQVERAHTGSFQLKSQHQLTQETNAYHADIIILCTGYKRRWPNCLSTLLEQAKVGENGGLLLAENFALQPSSIHSDKEALGRIFMLNAGMESHGIADPQLSLISWRAAKIINSIYGKEVYSLAQDSLLPWNSLGKNQQSLSTMHPSTPHNIHRNLNHYSMENANP